MADPVSWLMVEPGWRVVASDGVRVGRVDEVVGDTDTDIFNGLTVASGVIAAPKYVPAEAVRQIREGEVELTVSGREFERLQPRDGPGPRTELRP
jgi:hypothetical protein